MAISYTFSNHILQVEFARFVGRTNQGARGNVQETEGFGIGGPFIESENDALQQNKGRERKWNSRCEDKVIKIFF